MEWIHLFAVQFVRWLKTATVSEREVSGTVSHSGQVYFPVTAGLCQGQNSKQTTGSLLDTAMTPVV